MAPGILRHTRAYAQAPVIRVGHVSPRTGPLAGFAEADPYILGKIQELFSKAIENNGQTYTIEIISKDSQFNLNRASEVAAELILSDEVDLIVAASAPDTTNSAADRAEINEVPRVTTDCEPLCRCGCHPGGGGFGSFPLVGESRGSEADRRNRHLSGDCLPLEFVGRLC